MVCPTSYEIAAPFYPLISLYYLFRSCLDSCCFQDSCTLWFLKLRISLLTVDEVRRLEFYLLWAWVLKSMSVAPKNLYWLGQTYFLICHERQNIHLHELGLYVTQNLMTDNKTKQVRPFCVLTCEYCLVILGLLMKCLKYSCRGKMKIKGSMSAAQKFTPDIFPKPAKLWAVPCGMCHC